jgi:hypothetical protein
MLLELKWQTNLRQQYIDYRTLTQRYSCTVTANGAVSSKGQSKYCAYYLSVWFADTGGVKCS